MPAFAPAMILSPSGGSAGKTSHPAERNSSASVEFGNVSNVTSGAPGMLVTPAAITDDGEQLGEPRLSIFDALARLEIVLALWPVNCR
jgi:hypothetical protein